MKSFNYLIIITLLISVLNLSCAQKFEKPPMKNKNNLVDKKPIRLVNVIQHLSQLSVNDAGLFCLKIDNECNVLDGITTIYSQYQTTGDDNPSIIPFVYAEGEFLNGKYNGKWIFYDKNGKIIKNENWRNGSLIITKK